MQIILTEEEYNKLKTSREAFDESIKLEVDKEKILIKEKIKKYLKEINYSLDKGLYRNFELENCIKDLIRIINL